MAVLGLTRRRSSVAPEARSDTRIFTEMKEALEFERADNMDLRESIEDLQRAVEDMGWAPLGPMGADENGLTLSAISTASQTTRALYAANPLVKRGIRARIGYVWGEGVVIKGNKTKRIMDKNRNTVFSKTALAELEAAAATDGNVLFQLNRQTLRILRIPLRQITQVISDPDQPEIKFFLQRSWTTQVLNVATGNIETRRSKVWYPTLDYIDTGAAVPAVINDVVVEQNEAIHAACFNRQVGWLWGVPDLLPALFWSKAYKEFLESQYTLVRSLARFAFKVTNTAKQSGAATRKAAIKVATPQNVDPVTGVRTDAGGTVLMGGGNDLTAVNKAGANVSFDAGRPLAAMVAAALDIPLVTVLAESDKSGTTDVALDVPTVKAMQSRQTQWDEELTRMFVYLGATTANVVFPPIQAAPIHRVIQAITTAAANGVLFPEEVRDLIVKALHAYGIEPKAGMPEPGQWQSYATPAVNNPGTTPQSTPDNTDPTKRSPAGALADGDHELRPSQ